MHNTVCMSFAASSLLKPKQASNFSRYIKQPILQLSREFHDPCEPRHISWQWRAKGSPEVQKCSSLCIKKKPKKKLFSRFRKEITSKDPQQCEQLPPDQVPKPLSWSEYFSFLLPEEFTKKPPMVMCRKMLEHRRRKCIGPDDYLRCIRGECWPPPTEWYGQGVMHISELGLVKPFAEEAGKPCPPAARMISRCIPQRRPSCDKPCTADDELPVMPYTQFKGAQSDGTLPPFTLKCPIKHKMELLPQPHLDKSYKLSCKSYGEVKEVECPPQMFNRYMNVDFTSKNLLPIPTTSPAQKPLREIKKGVCGRQTFLRPPSARNFSTGRALLMNDLPEFVQIVDASRLQPGRSAICFDKLVDRAGLNSDLLQKPVPTRSYGIGRGITHFTEKELEQHELEARKSEESEEERLRKINEKKTKLQLLIEKKKAENKSDKEPVLRRVSSSGGGDPTLSQPFLNRTMVDLEDVPYQRSGFHTSASLFARKNDKEMKSHSKSSLQSNEEDEKICSGCPGIRGLENNKSKFKSKCSTTKGGIKGRCKTDRPLRPGERMNPLTLKCKGVTDSPCMRPRPHFWGSLGVSASSKSLMNSASQQQTFGSNLSTKNWSKDDGANASLVANAHSFASLSFRSPFDAVFRRQVPVTKPAKKILRGRSRQENKKTSRIFDIFAGRYQNEDAIKCKESDQNVGLRSTEKIFEFKINQKSLPRKFAQYLQPAPSQNKSVVGSNERMFKQKVKSAVLRLRARSESALLRKLRPNDNPSKPNKIVPKSTHGRAKYPKEHEINVEVKCAKQTLKKLVKEENWARARKIATEKALLGYEQVRQDTITRRQSELGDNKLFFELTDMDKLPKCRKANVSLVHSKHTKEPSTFMKQLSTNKNVFSTGAVRKDSALSQHVVALSTPGSTSAPDPSTCRVEKKAEEVPKQNGKTEEKRKNKMDEQLKNEAVEKQLERQNETSSALEEENVESNHEEQKKELQQDQVESKTEPSEESGEVEGQTNNKEKKGETVDSRQETTEVMPQEVMSQLARTF